MKNWFHTVLVKASDFLTGTRPASYVRRMQVYLLVLTLIVTTFALAYPGLVQAELDLSKWVVGKNAPASVVSVSNLEFPRMQQFELARKEAGRQAPLYFIRDYSVLGGGTGGPVTGYGSPYLSRIPCPGYGAADAMPSKRGGDGCGAGLHPQDHPSLEEALG